MLKHRKRREKTVRKLDAMQANLNRLTDLTGEIRRQLGPLGRQAAVARRAAGVQADLRDAKMRLLADDLAQITAKIAQEAVDEQAAIDHRKRVQAALAAASAEQRTRPRRSCARRPRRCSRPRTPGSRCPRWPNGCAAPSRWPASAPGTWPRRPGTPRTGRDPGRTRGGRRAGRGRAGGPAGDGRGRGRRADRRHRRTRRMRTGAARRRGRAGRREPADRRPAGGAGPAGRPGARGPVAVVRRRRRGHPAGRRRHRGPRTGGGRRGRLRRRAGLGRRPRLLRGRPGRGARGGGRRRGGREGPGRRADRCAAHRADRARRPCGPGSTRCPSAWTAGTAPQALLAAGETLPGLLGGVADALDITPGYETAIAAALGAIAEAVAVSSVPDAVQALELLRSQRQWPRRRAHPGPAQPTRPARLAGTAGRRALGGRPAHRAGRRCCRPWPGRWTGSPSCPTWPSRSTLLEQHSGRPGGHRGRRPDRARLGGRRQRRRAVDAGDPGHQGPRRRRAGRDQPADRRAGGRAGRRDGRGRAAAAGAKPEPLRRCTIRTPGCPRSPRNSPGSVRRPGRRRPRRTGWTGSGRPPRSPGSSTARRCPNWRTGCTPSNPRRRRRRSTRRCGTRSPSGPPLARQREVEARLVQRTAEERARATAGQRRVAAPRRPPGTAAPAPGRRRRGHGAPRVRRSPAGSSRWAGGSPQRLEPLAGRGRRRAGPGDGSAGRGRRRADRGPGPGGRAAGRSGTG